MSTNTKSYMKEPASETLARYVAGHLTFAEMQAFQARYTEVIQEYNRSPLRLLSEVRLNELPEFGEWLQTLVENKDKALPLLIVKMLKGDIFALNIYENLRRHLGQDVSDKYSLNEDLRAVTNAKHWLTTEDAANILNTSEEGRDTLCQVNNMLGVHNDFVDC